MQAVKITITANVIMALLGLGAAMGFRVNLDSETVQALAGGLFALIAAVNAVLHAAHDHGRMGVQSGDPADAAPRIPPTRGEPGDVADPGSGGRD